MNQKCDRCNRHVSKFTTRGKELICKQCLEVGEKFEKELIIKYCPQCGLSASVNKLAMICWNCNIFIEMEIRWLIGHE